MIDIKIPYRLQNVSNIYEHHFNRAKRVKKEREFLSILVKPQIHALKLPVSILLVRVAPRPLDKDDNLRGAFKSVKDILASFFLPELKPGQADDLPCFEWHYAQQKGATKEYAIRVMIKEM